MAADALSDLDRLTDLVLELPPELRELVAYRIWESLHGEESWQLDEEQLAEIKRRAAEVQAGEIMVVDADEAIRRARARIAAYRK